MRAISVKQPWAALLASGIKRTENRGRAHPWTSAVGERLALHASLTGDTSVHRDVLAVAFATQPDARGAILGTFELIGVHHGSGKCRCDRAFAHPDTWHLVCRDVQRLDQPVPARGALGLWTVPAEVEAQIRTAVPV